MDKRSDNRRLLFLNTHDGNAGPRRTRSKSLDSRIRHHLMVDIGRSRRKPPKARQFDTLAWSLADTSKTQPNTHRNKDSTNRDDARLQAYTADLMVPDTSSSYSSPLPMPPILYTLSTFEKEWGEDWFSAYGFTLIMVAGRNAMRFGQARSTNTFWFPFAFKNSAFLRHYQGLFTSPYDLIPLYRQSARELRSLALDRSLVTIQCVESRLASPDASIATSDDVISAVIAMACYNFTSLEFDQAMIHVKGVRMVIEARGGIPTLETNQNLILMISWVDITAALLYDTKPQFPLSANMASGTALHRPGLEMLPVPLISVNNDEKMQDARLSSVLWCIADLNALSTQLQVELVIRGEAIWVDEEQMGYLIHPVTHRLLSQQPITSSESMTSCDIVSEALRLGAIIWIIFIKRGCRSYPGTAQTRISTLLKMLSSNTNVEKVWNSSTDLQTVRLWLLVLCSISEPSDQDHGTLNRMIASGMEEKELFLWDEFMSTIRLMPWIDVFEVPCAELGHRLTQNYP